MSAQGAAHRLPSVVAALLVGFHGCGNPSTKTLRDWSRRLDGQLPQAVPSAHQGPGVAPGTTGPARFARAIYRAFNADRAMQVATFADGYYREPGNEGFEAVLDRVREDLETSGFGKESGLLLETFETPMDAPAWTPRRGRIVLRVDGEPDRKLHEFVRPGDRDRTMLPVNAPSASVEGAVAFDVATAEPGAVVVTEERLSRELLRRASDRGVAAVLSAALPGNRVDPSGKERHLDAIAYTSVSPGGTLPVAMISRRALASVRDASGWRRRARIAFEAEVATAERPLRTLVATIVGSKSPGDAVVLPAHVQEPGACDNASGVATTLEGARALAWLLRRGDLEVPLRSIAFVWGDEMEQSRVWLEKSGRRAIAAIAADMTGESKEATGAIALLERAPDPGAVVPLPPDEHTSWGSSEVDASTLAPSGLTVIARCALVDVGALAKGWTSREHPYEGGSDHVVFLEAGIPSVLFWHFEDFAYHTSLDRLDHVDREEMRREGTAILASAMAVADARACDLERYLESLRHELDLRLFSCAEARRDDVAELWKQWCKGARLKLIELCLGQQQEASPAAPSETSTDDRPASDDKETP